MTAHKRAHKNPHTPAVPVRAARGRRWPRREVLWAVLWAVLWVAGHSGSGWACVLLGQDWFCPVPVAVVDRLCGGTAMVTEQPALSFAGLLRRLRAGAKLTQYELAAAAGVSARSVSNLERGVNRTAHKDTAVLLAGALGLAGPAEELFVAAARGNVPAAQVLAAAEAAGPRPGVVTRSPYRGLASFGEQDAGWFFGREAATGQVLERMSRLLAGTGLLVVSGASGAGKSSLLRAGVLPRIGADGLAAAPGSWSWPCLVLTPTRAPLDELALRVAPLAGTDASAVRRGLDTAPTWFALTARQAALARPPGPAGDPDSRPAEQERLPRQQRVVLVIDQFEELFTQCPEEGQRRAFITALHAAADIGHGPDQTPAALVVLGVRADFEVRCAGYPQLADAIQDRYLLRAMTERQLRMAITEPAKKAGSQVDDDLAEVLLADVRTGQPETFGAGVLPLLSHALDQAWRSRTGQVLTLADYERTGGIDGAVATSAQRAYATLTPAQQAAARQVFLRLTATSSDGVDSADRVTRAELTAGKSPAEALDVEAVLEAFAAERLLTLAAGTVELSHEALLTAWPLLHDTWLADTHADRIVRTRLHTSAAEWARHSRDPSYLYSGSLLAAATGTATRISADPARHPPLSQTDQDFLRASDHARRRSVRRRQSLVALLAALVIGLAAVTGLAVHARQQVAQQRDIALARLLISESHSVASNDPALSRLLSVAAWRINPSHATRHAMLAAAALPIAILTSPGHSVVSVAFSPDRKTLAIGNSDGTVQLWNLATSRPVVTLHATSARYGADGVAFSPDGKLLASGDGDGTVRLWDLATGRPVVTLHATSARNAVFGVAFSPDGKLLASAGIDGTVRLWNLATGRPVGAPLQAGSRPDTGVPAVVFTRDGKLASGDGTVVTFSPDGVTAVAFSSDGKLLASAGIDGTVRLWNPATGRPVVTIHATRSARFGVLGVAFSSDGKLLASAGIDGTVRLWNPATGRPIGAPIHASVHNDVTAVAFSSDGKTLASGSLDGTVRLWNIATHGQNVAQITDLVPYLCASAGRPLTRAEWARYVPQGLAYQRVCP
jgi:transcriptional regulator with XRE-family HTH domain